MDDATDVEVTAFDVVPEQSTVVVATRSSVGPINWQATGLAGRIQCAVADRHVDLTAAPTGTVLLSVERLTSRNAVYDAELRRRIDARRYPSTMFELGTTRRTGADGRYELDGVLTFHGVPQDIEGVVTLSVEDGALTVTGEKVIDIRDFDIPLPHMLLLTIYPTVRVYVSIRAEPA